MVKKKSYLLSFLNKLKSIEMIKVFSLTAISTIIKMITNLVSMKFVAVLVGPIGVALLGQLNNFVTIVLNFATGGINNGVTKYVAEYKEDKGKTKLYLSTAFKIMLTTSIAIGLLLIFLSSLISSIILKDNQYFYVFVIFGFTLIFYSLNMLMISILNGFKEFKKYVKVNVIGSLIGLFFSLLLVFNYGLEGVLIATMTSQSLMFFVTLIIIKKVEGFSFSYLKEKLNYSIAKDYSKYTIMTLTTALTIPLSQLILRGYIISDISIQDAGYWEGMNKISNMYLSILTTSFSVYYLPKLSETIGNSLLRKEVFKSFKIILPILFLGLVIIYFSRFLLINLIFTNTFTPMSELFLWQLIGDFFKILSWILAFIMVAKSMTKKYIITEILAVVFYIPLAFYMMKINGVLGVTQSYMINSFIYFMMMIFIFRKLIFKQLNN